MPAGPGDSNLATLFADVHYYFASPTSKPQHHRFSRGSYVYLYHNITEHKAKLEIANHAGTPDQDAFSGNLEYVARLSYSYKQPNLCTLILDSASIQGHDQWHLPSYDERNEQKYLYKIHTLDIYLWTEKDAFTFLDHLKGLLRVDKLDIRDVPASLQTEARLQTPAEHRDSMSPVVQQLEQTAIGAQFPPRAESTASAHSLPGPPTPASASIGAAASPPAQATPMAYNPAAPPAPEPIAYREKTPPPMDDGTGIGLQNAARYDSMPQTQYANMPHTFQNSNQHTPNQAYFSGPPAQSPPQQQQMRHPSFTGFPGPPSQSTPSPQQRTQSGALPPPPPPNGGPSPSQQKQYTPSFAPPPLGQQQPTSPPPNQPSFPHRQSSFGGIPGQTQYANYNPSQQTPSFGPGALASPGFGPQATGQQPPTPSAPPGYSSPGLPPPPPSSGQVGQGVFGYSNYAYTSHQQDPAQGYTPGQPQPGYSGDVHSQVYRPTEAEAGGAYGASGGVASGAGSGMRPGQQRQNSETRQKLEGRVRDVEGRVGGYLKRLDKLW